MKKGDIGYYYIPGINFVILELVRVKIIKIAKQDCLAKIEKIFFQHNKQHKEQEVLNNNYLYSLNDLPRCNVIQMIFLGGKR